MKKYNALLDEIKKSRPVFGFLMGKCLETTMTGTVPDVLLDKAARPGFSALAPLDFVEVGVDDLVNAAARSGVSQ